MNMPLGQKIWEQRSRAVGRRILDVTERGIHEEVSWVGEVSGFGLIEGVEGRIVGTDNYIEKTTGEIISGSACGVLTFQDHIVGFKALGLARMVKHSPLAIENLLSLIYFVDPPPDLGWMRNTLIVWEAITDPKVQSVLAQAHEWVGLESEAVGVSKR
jgi:hypothetical protein